MEDVRTSRIDRVLDEISAYLLFDNNNLERLSLDEFYDQMADFTRLCAADVAGKSYRVEEALRELVTMLFQRATAMLKECVDVTATTDGRSWRIVAIKRIWIRICSESRIGLT